MKMWDFVVFQYVQRVLFFAFDLVAFIVLFALWFTLLALGPPAILWEDFRKRRQDARRNTER